MTVSPISLAPPAPSGSSGSDSSGSGSDHEFFSLMGASLGKQSAGSGRADDARGASESRPASRADSGTASDSDSTVDSTSGSTSGSTLGATSGESVGKELQKSDDEGDPTPGSQAASVLSILSGMLSGAQGVAVASSAAHVEAAVAKNRGKKTGADKVADAPAAGKATTTPTADALQTGVAAAAATSGKPSVSVKSSTDAAGSEVPDKKTVAGSSSKLPATSHALGAPRSEQGLAHSALTRTEEPGTSAGHKDGKNADAKASAQPGPTAQPTGVQDPAQAGAAAASARTHTAPRNDRADSSSTLPLTNNLAASVAPVAQTATVSGPTGTPQAATVPGGSIPDQVFGEVTRLISRGDGTHRITLNLHPADLGDVRVTLTLKDGSVSVSLAAGQHAQQALASGSHELHRLLQATGAHTADIVVKDLPVQTTTRFDLDPGAANGGQAGGHTPEQTARTWSGDTSARDGNPTRTITPPSANPGTRTRSSGVDVSM